MKGVTMMIWLQLTKRGGKREKRRNEEEEEYRVREEKVKEVDEKLRKGEETEGEVEKRVTVAEVILLRRKTEGRRRKGTGN